MTGIDEVRANEFDRWVGKLQTDLSIEYGVGDSLLDIGCGIGMYTPMFQSRFSKIVGVDPSEEHITEARKEKNTIEYIIDYGETYHAEQPFDTINMTMLLEHVENPETLLRNCKKNLAPNGHIIIHVPNAESITRRLGVIMKVIPSIDYISKKEKEVYGHKRVYTLRTLYDECIRAGLEVKKTMGVLYKPLPNEMLLSLCKQNDEIWTREFMKALMMFGSTPERITECANLMIVCQ